MRTGLGSTIETSSAIAVPAVLVPGNAETDAELSRACAITAVTSAAARSSPALERKRPALVLCGDVHQCWGEEVEIGTTPVVSVGPEGRFFDI